MGETRKLRKGLWSPEEDEKLRRSIAMYMNGTWSDIARKAGLARCGKSCRRRWMNHLRPNIRKGRFTPTEINQILQLHKDLGNRWSKIADHLVGRTDNDVKNLWNSQIKRRHIKQMHLQLAPLDVKDEKIIAGQDAHELVALIDNLTTNKVDVVESLASDASDNSSPSISSSSHSFHHLQENNIITPMITFESPFTHKKLEHTNRIEKYTKLASISTFPFNSTPLCFSNPLHNIIQDDFIINSSNSRNFMVNSFPTPPHMHFIDQCKDSLTCIYASNAQHITQGCTSMMHHIPRASSGSNSNKISSSHHDKCGTKTKVSLLDHYHMEDGANVTYLPYLEVDTHTQYNHNSVVKPKSTQMMMVNNVNQWHKDCNIPHIESQESSSKEGANPNRTYSSTSCSRTIDSYLSLPFQFGSSCKSAIASMLSEERHLLNHANNDENNVMGTLTSSMINTYVGATKGLEGTHESLENNSTWWSTLEVPHLEFPNLECW